MSKAGRPTKYKEEYIEEIRVYLKECTDILDDYHKTRGEKSDSYERVIKVNLPMVEGFALRLGVNKTTIYEWAKNHKRFSNALGQIKIEQKKRLIEMGLSGDYNPTIAKLVLSANHGMVERQDVTTKGNELPKPIIDLTDELQKYNSNEEDNKIK